jgi:O-antigen/teichoic acid export membrane protein
MTYADSLVIASFLSTSAVTYYVVGSRMIKYAKDLIEVLMNVLAPAVSELDAKRDSTIGDVFILSSKAAALLSFPILFFFIIQGDDFLKLWIGIVYPQSHTVMVILSVCSLFILPQMSVVPILYGTAKHRLIMNVQIIEGIVSVISSILLCKYFGLIGVAFGLAAPKVIVGCIIYPIYMSQFASVNILYFLINAYLRPAIVTLPVIISLLLIKQTLEFTWPVLVFEIFICFLLHLFFVIWIGLSLKEKDKLLPQFHKLRSYILK